MSKAKMMTFEQFQETRRQATREMAIRAGYLEPENIAPFAGFAYLNDFSHFIETTDQWANRQPEPYYLMLANEEHLNANLEPLERILYTYIFGGTEQATFEAAPAPARNSEIGVSMKAWSGLLTVDAATADPETLMGIDDAMDEIDFVGIIERRLGERFPGVALKVVLK